MFTYFFFNDTATTEIYTLSLHDALPISVGRTDCRGDCGGELRLPLRHGEHVGARADGGGASGGDRDRKSTRLNSSHANISYAVFCLKKKKQYNACLIMLAAQIMLSSNLS